MLGCVWEAPALHRLSDLDWNNSNKSTGTNFLGWRQPGVMDAGLMLGCAWEDLTLYRLSDLDWSNSVNKQCILGGQR